MSMEKYLIKKSIPSTSAEGSENKNIPAKEEKIQRKSEDFPANDVSK